jgi:parallel beta-helix repeat protein
MLKRRLRIIFLITFLFLITTSAVLGAEITVNPTKTNAQDAINNAIDSVASDATANNKGCVLLIAGTYNISAPIVLKSNMVLKGVGDDTIIFASSDSVCNSKKEHGYITGADVSNVEICNLQFRSTASKFSDGGIGEYRDCIVLKSANKCTVHDILFTRYLYNDGVQIFGSNNITIYNCRFYSAAHDGVSIVSDSENCRVSNCDVQVQTNTGVRVDSGINCEVDHNTFTSGTPGSGWCCVELENKLDNVDIHHNIMHDFRGSSNSAGIGSVRAKGSINIHDNIMWNVSPYMQVGSQANNMLGPEDENVSNWVAKGYGYGSIDAASIILTSSEEKTEPKGNLKMPAFELSYGIIGLLSVFLYKKR